MKTNEEFKQLVNDKYRLMNQKKRAFQRKLLTVGSSLLVCVIVLSVFIGSGMYKRIFPHYEEDIILDTVSEENRLDGDLYDTSNSENTLSSVNSSPDLIIPDESTSENAEEINSDDISEIFEDEFDDSYQITPDGFNNINETVELMKELFAYTGGDVSSLPDDSFKPDEPSWPKDEGTENEAKAPENTDSLQDIDTINGLADFSFSLFRNSYKSGENNILSPASTYYSLAMSANGAHGNTQRELIDTLCGTDLDRLNEFMLEYHTLYGKAQYHNTQLNGALWFDSDISIDKNFLQRNFDYFRMEAFKTVMQDEMALYSINGWISQKTYGLIPEMLDEIAPNTDILIANTVYFDASWDTPLTLLKEKQNFTTASGDIKQIEMMSGSTNHYLENDYCTGFIKSYGEGKKSDYSFVALLPKDDMSIIELIDTLDSNAYYDLINNKTAITTEFIMPKFECTAEYELSDALKAAGINDAFNANRADFSRMTDSDIYLSSILQSVTISVHEKGTLAASATVMQYPGYGFPTETKCVSLDKPFVYMIIDNTTNLPIYIGSVEDF